jgi:hypothetical protein
MSIMSLSRQILRKVTPWIGALLVFCATGRFVHMLTRAPPLVLILIKINEIHFESACHIQTPVIPSSKSLVHFP